MSEGVLRRVLLDENVDRPPKPLFREDLEVRTVWEQEWDGLRNRELLRAASDVFDVFVTMDENLSYQQNLKVLDLAVVVIRSASNESVDEPPLTPEVNAAVRIAEAGAAPIVVRLQRTAPDAARASYLAFGWRLHCCRVHSWPAGHGVRRP